MANSVTCRAPAWVDGVQVSGAEMRAGVLYGVWGTDGLVRGLRAVQIPTPAMQIRVPAGLCVVADGQNGYLPLELAAQTDLDIAASSPTNPRIDSLIAEWTDDGVSSVRRLRVITGTPAGSPSAPSLPPADNPTAKCLRIANIAVAAGATTITTGNISTVANNARHHGQLFVRKTANESLSSTITPQADDELFVTLEPQTRYKFTCLFPYGVRSDTDGIVGLVYPANATADWMISSKAGTAQADGNAGTPAFDLLDKDSEPRIGGWQANNTSKMAALLQGVVYSGDGGTFGIRWSQAASNPTAMIVYAGAWLEAVRE